MEGRHLGWTCWKWQQLLNIGSQYVGPPFHVTILEGFVGLGQSEATPRTSYNAHRYNSTSTVPPPFCGSCILGTAFCGLGLVEAALQQGTICITVRLVPPSAASAGLVLRSRKSCTSTHRASCFRLQGCSNSRNTTQAGH